MIVVRAERRILVITQPDHARFSGELLSLWKADGLPAHPRRDDLIFATREHDNGWREADSAPRMDPATALPYDFLGFPLSARLDVWRLGVDRFAVDRPWPALLILRHALEINRRHSCEDPAWSEFLEELDELQAEILQASGWTEQDLAADYVFLELADTLSLAACCRWSQPLTRPGTSAKFVEGELRISPFPLAGATTFEIPCRRIPDRRYSGDADLGVELASATWESTTVRVTEGLRTSA